MTKLIDVKILKIFVGESAQHKGKPVHEAIVAEANQRGMAGASVHRGFMGFGANNLLHTTKILRLSEDLPIMIEIVDTPERIDDFLPVADAMLDDGSIVVQNGQAVFYVRIFFGYSPKRDQLAVSLLWEAGVELADINAARLRVDGESYKLIFSREKTVNLDGRRVVRTRGKLRRKWTWLEAN